MDVDHNTKMLLNHEITTHGQGLVAYNIAARRKVIMPLLKELPNQAHYIAIPH